MQLTALIDPVVRFALPPRCASCGLIVDQDHRLCIVCWQALDFLGGEGCTACFRPMPQPGLICGPCLASPPAHDGVLGVVSYGEVARRVVLKLKHGRRPGVARTIARHMARKLALLEDALVIPVPLHRWRLWSRGFNQSLLIARALPPAPGRTLVVDALMRHRQTPMLKGMTRAERARTVRGAFLLNPRYRDDIRGRKICLVDDVYTTGATTDACAKLLKKAGAEKVYVLCWARVLADQEALH